MHKIVATGPGGIEVLKYIEVENLKPAEGEVLVKLEVIGVNFADIYARRGANGETPMGREGAGIVEEVGSGNTEFKKGDKVAFADTLGAYSEFIVVPTNRLVAIPENLTTKQAATVLLQGMTAHYLATSTYPLAKPDTALIHAAAGGVGELLIQIAKMRGARVLGTVSTKQKAEIAKELGADEVINYTETDFVEEAKKLTNSKGVDVIYDSVGKDTLVKGLDALKARGTMVSFGQASGPVEPLDISQLVLKGSLTLSKVSLKDYTTERSELLQRANEIFDWVGSGKLNLRVFKEIPLEQAAEAQKELENRETVGKLLLIP